MREVELVREVCVATLDHALGPDGRARQAGVSALGRLLRERTRGCLSGFRASCAAAG